MSDGLFLDNLLAYAMQVAVLVAAGGLLAWGFKLRDPRVSLVYWRGLLAACLLLPLAQPWRVEVVQLTPATPAVSGPVSTVNAVANAAAAPVSRAELILLLLAVGFAARLCWTGIGLLRLHFYRRRARPLSDPPAFIPDLRSALGPTTAILLSAEVPGPVTFGLLRPTILLPESFTGQPERVQRAVLCHEMLHVARRDAAYTLAEELIAGLLWFHPGIWWLLGRIRLACEQAVDRQAIEMIADRQQYLHAVLETAGVRVPAPGTGFASPILNKSHLVERVALIVQEIRMSKLRLFASASASIALLFAAGVLAVHSFPLKAEPQAAASPAAPVIVKPEVQAKRLVYSPPCVALEGMDVHLTIGVLIGRDGNVISTAIGPAAPRPLVAAADCVKLWRYEPLIVDGKPVEVSTSAMFSMSGGKTSNTKMPGVAGGVPGGVPGGVVGGIVGNAPAGGEPGGQPPATTSEDKKPQPPASDAFPPTEPGQMRIRVGGNVQQARAINAPEPVYPPLAMQARIQGVVKFNVLLSEAGEVKQFALISGHPLLVPAAKDALAQYRYQQTLLNGQPVEVVTQVDINFNLPQ